MRARSIVGMSLGIFIVYFIILFSVPMFIHQMTLEEIFRPRKELPFDLIQWPPQGHNRFAMANRLASEKAFLGESLDRLERKLGEPNARTYTAGTLRTGYRLCDQKDMPASFPLFNLWFSNLDAWYLEFESTNGIVFRSCIKAR